MEEFGLEPTEVSLYVSDSPAWENLVGWLQAFHGGEQVIAPEFDAELRSDRLVITGMFHTVAEMACRPWKAVEKLMVQQRVLLERLDPRWED